MKATGHIIVTFLAIIATSNARLLATKVSRLKLNKCANMACFNFMCEFTVSEAHYAANIGMIYLHLALHSS